MNHLPKKVVYISDAELIKNCNAVPMFSQRASLVHELLDAFKLLEKLTVVPSCKATEEDIRKFHSEEYVEFLKSSSDDEHSEDEEDSFGLGFDCPIFSDIWTVVQHLAGASLKAANEIVYNDADIAINWCGGWHHSQRDSASGFCYVNDIVLAIQQLRVKFKKILYIDLDTHHGDGVENAFIFSKNVFTLSFHEHGPGFFPGTGSVAEVGLGDGKNFTMNIPYHPRITDEEFKHLFESLIYDVYDLYRPDAIVCQCGADALAKDPLGEANLTIRGYTDCVKSIMELKVPILFLGGGGYNKVNTAKLWTAITATILQEELPEEIPEHTFFPLYGPDFTSNICPSLRRSQNTNGILDSTIKTCLSNLQSIRKDDT